MKCFWIFSSSFSLKFYFSIDFIAFHSSPRLVDFSFFFKFYLYFSWLFISVEEMIKLLFHTSIHDSHRNAKSTRGSNKCSIWGPLKALNLKEKKMHAQTEEKIAKCAVTFFFDLVQCVRLLIKNGDKLFATRRKRKSPKHIRNFTQFFAARKANKMIKKKWLLFVSSTWLLVELLRRENRYVQIFICVINESREKQKSMALKYLKLLFLQPRKLFFVLFGFSSFCDRHALGV